MKRSESYAAIVRDVHALIDKYVENDPTVVAYMGARAFLLEINAMRGSEKTAEVAYALADEFGGMVRK